LPSHNKRVGRRVWKEVWEKGQRTKAIGVGRKKKKKFSQELPREFTAKLLYRWRRKRYEKEREKR